MATSFANFGNELYTGKRSYDFVGSKKIWFLIAAVLVFVGRWRIKKVGPPQRAISSTQATIEAIKHHDATAERVVLDVREPVAGRLEK